MEQPALTLQYRELDRDCALLSYRLQGPNSFAEELFIPTAEALARAREDREALCGRLEALEAPDAVYALVKRHLADFLDSLEYAIEDAGKNPAQIYLGFPYRFQNVVRCDRRPDEERCASLAGLADRLEADREQFLALVRGDKEEAGRTASALRRTRVAVEGDKERLEEFFPSFSVDQRERIAAAMERYCALLGGMADSLSEDPVPAGELPEDDLSVNVKMDPEDYRTLLSKKLGVSLDELLSWHREEMEKTRREVFQIARKLDIPETREGGPGTMEEVKDILFRYEGPCGRGCP